MKGKVIIGGLLAVISVMSIFAFLIFEGIFIPNQLEADKFLIKGVDVASYQGKID
ncbi:putative lysozyme [Bacillus clarus]|uniref:Putative lysozyme n=1 Tax=Bacillus clarus TaxID=2338372 RepID=A0A090YYR5_9BACI|nr:putative lysozyme [Bacillus clarus]